MQGVPEDRVLEVRIWAEHFRLRWHLHSLCRPSVLAELAPISMSCLPGTECSAPKGPVPGGGIRRSSSLHSQACLGYKQVWCYTVLQLSATSRSGCGPSTWGLT